MNFYLKRYLIVTIVGFLASGCHTVKDSYTETPVATLYQSAEKAMKAQRYEEAADLFDEVERQHPHDRHAIRSQILSSYCAFKAQKFSRAIGTLDNFIMLHPGSSLMGYVYYLRALCYYTEIFPVLRDKENAQLALKALEEVIQRFPTTEYAQDAHLKKDFVYEHLASQDMCIAKDYLIRSQYVAAFKRFGDMIKDWPRSVLIPEVLYRLEECQIALGLWRGAQKTLELLCYNFPKESWSSMGKALWQKHAPKPSARPL